MGRIDDAMWLAGQPDVIFTCFGDMMRVPGSAGSLLDAKARGADVRFVYSPLDALKIAIDNPDKHVVFFAIGFETTAPSTAVTLVRARELGLPNFSVFCNHVTIVPPIKAILESPDLRLSGFIGPGHVSTVVGLSLIHISFLNNPDVDACFVVRSQSVHRIQESQALLGYQLWVATHERPGDQGLGAA